MNTIIGKRGSGKTTALIKLSSKHQLYILVLNRKRQKQLFQQAHDLGYQIPFPITLDDYLVDKLRGSHIREILIDDIDDILKYIFNTVKINTVSLTNQDSIHRLAADPQESEADLDIDEEIKKFESNAEFERTHENLRGCQEFKKLAEWLKELKELKALKAEPCEDTISRETALLALTGVNLLSKKPEELISLFDMRIKALPSVTPKQKWIPVSERLPEQGQEVICQCRANIIKVMRLDADFDWYQDANHCYIHKFVVAWMPLPEAYKEESEV